MPDQQKALVVLCTEVLRSSVKSGVVRKVFDQDRCIDPTNIDFT